MSTRTIKAFMLGAAVASAALLPPVASRAEPKSVTSLDQWPAAARDLFYTQDQGSRLMPFAWLKALRQPGGQPFLVDSLARYGYLPGTKPDGLPIGFVEGTDPTGKAVGLTCAACHTRQIVVADRTYRIDGGPSFADFESFVGDLDRAVLAVLADPARFKAFSDAVLGPQASAGDMAMLEADVTVWSARFHTLMSTALPTGRRWGPARIDAISMIFDRIAGLDLGPAPTYLVPANITPATAPVRNPFLWNSWRQDFTQWTGFAANGNEVLALSRNLGQVYGVFGLFHPRSIAGSVSIFDRNYIVDNSANILGLGALETVVTTLKPPTWPWAIDAALARQGKRVFERPNEDGKACADCHGIRPGQARPPTMATWSTPVIDVGTDRSAWLVLTQKADSASLTGASIPGAVAPLAANALKIDLVKIAVTGAIGEYKAAMAHAPKTPPPKHDSGAAKTAMMPMPTMPMAQMDAAFHLPGMPFQTPAPRMAPAPPTPFSYEARVLQGIWAAAPYLHNGSVPTLADLLKPADQRPKDFKVGPAYDIGTVGLAVDQPGAGFTLHTTGCDDLASGDSRCGHAYGTHLPDADKAALLEYLKAL